MEKLVKTATAGVLVVILGAFFLRSQLGKDTVAVMRGEAYFDEVEEANKYLPWSRKTL